MAVATPVAILIQRIADLFEAITEAGGRALGVRAGQDDQREPDRGDPRGHGVRVRPQPPLPHSGLPYQNVADELHFDGPGKIQVRSSFFPSTFRNHSSGPYWKGTEESRFELRRGCNSRSDTGGRAEQRFPLREAWSSKAGLNTRCAARRDGPIARAVGRFARSVHFGSRSDGGTPEHVSVAAQRERAPLCSRFRGLQRTCGGRHAAGCIIAGRHAARPLFDGILAPPAQTFVSPCTLTIASSPQEKVAALSLMNKRVVVKVVRDERSESQCSTGAPMLLGATVRRCRRLK